MGVFDLEGLADEVVDEIDDGPVHVLERHLVDQNGSAVTLDDDIVLGLALLHVEGILEPGATSAIDADLSSTLAAPRP